MSDNVEYLNDRIAALIKDGKRKDEDLASFKKSIKMHLDNFPHITFMEGEQINYIEQLIIICDEARFEED